jgi:hypothetical protein
MIRVEHFKIFQAELEESLVPFTELSTERPTLSSLVDVATDYWCLEQMDLNYGLGAE